jgi:MoaA/NifB/PqqE/SkfB family radical SAM enzyme
MKAEKFEAILEHLKKIGMFQRKTFQGGGNRKRHLMIFVWSDPTLNPEINEILKIAGRYDFSCEISSNFIAPWKIDLENYQHIGRVTFSLCSLKEDRYKRIYGADLQTTLDNFKEFLKKREECGQRIFVRVNFIRYVWSEEEWDYVGEYFTKLLGNGRDTVIAGPYARMVDAPAMLSYAKSGGKELEGYNLEEARRDLKFERFYEEGRKIPFDCRLPGRLLCIDVNGQLLPCCIVSSKDPGHYNMGDILAMSKEDIFTRLRAAIKELAFCRGCKRYNIISVVCPPNGFHEKASYTIPIKPR